MNTRYLHPTNALAKPVLHPRRIRRTFNLASLLSLPAIWEERKHFRLQLADTLMRAPHLIDDMGLTMKQAEAEIAKRFWEE